MKKTTKKGIKKGNTKKNKITFKKEYIFYTIIFIIFVTLATIVSLKHEYWTDEASSWLIAADSSVKDLFTHYLHVEGHPALFHLVIKLFQAFGLQYKDFRIISLLFSSLGVFILLFKSNFKWYIKALLPFTYFIFYQYTIITRGYSLALFLLAVLATLWEKRKEKCVLFTIFLILLLNLEAYTFFMAGSIYFLYIVDYIIDYRKTHKHNKKYLICLIILFLSFLLTTIYVFPRSDNTFYPAVNHFYISTAFLSEYKDSLNIKLILSLIIFALFIFIYYKQHDKKKVFEVIILLLPLFLFMKLKYCNLWHIGMFTFLALFIFWIHGLSENKLFNIFMLIVCSVQIYWSANSSIYDYKEPYTPAKEVADFIKTYDYQNLKIYAQQFYEAQINAYFDENIFDNYQEDIRFFYWSRKNKYYSLDRTIEALKEENVDIFVSTPTNKRINRDELINDYDEYIFEGATHFEAHVCESMNTYVYVKKGLEPINN